MAAAADPSDDLFATSAPGPRTAPDAAANVLHLFLDAAAGDASEEASRLGQSALAAWTASADGRRASEAAQRLSDAEAQDAADGSGETKRVDPRDVFAAVFASRKELVAVREALQGSRGSSDGTSGSLEALKQDLYHALSVEYTDNLSTVDETPEARRVSSESYQYMRGIAEDESQPTVRRAAAAVFGMTLATKLSPLLVNVEKNAEAQALLEGALQLHNICKVFVGGMGEAAAIAVNEAVETAYIHVLFFLAQVYSNTGQETKGAQYCERTLVQMLPLVMDTQRTSSAAALFGSPLQWAGYCLKMADYYLLKHAVFQAAHCLDATQAMVNMIDQRIAAGALADVDAEEFCKLKADIHVAWGSLHLSVLADASNEWLAVQDARAQGLPEPAPPAPVFLSSEGDHWGASSGPFSGLGFTATAVIEPGAVRSFEAARDVFKVALPHFYDAMEFYVLDGYVTTHVNLSRQVAQLYKRLAVFESEPKREIAMHEREAEILKPLLSKLNPAVYIHQFKELSLQCAQAWCDIAEVYYEMGSASSLSAKQVKAASNAIATCVQYFTAFFKCWKDPRLGGITRLAPPVGDPWPGATAVDEESADVYLSAHATVAWLLGRHPDPAEQRVAWSACADRHEFVVKVQPSLLPHPSEFFVHRIKLIEDILALRRATLARGK